MKKTAKIFSLLLAILMLAASLALFAACGDSYDEEITVYNWEDYIYSKTELQNDFNEYYKVKTGKNRQGQLFHFRHQRNNAHQHNKRRRRG